MNLRLKSLRKALSLSQKEFGNRLGISDAAISLLESGKRKLTESSIRSICHEFDVNYSWLKEGTGEMFNVVPETLVDEIVKEYNLDEVDRRIISGYLALTEQDRTTVRCYIQGIMNVATTNANAATEPMPKANPSKLLANKTTATMPPTEPVGNSDKLSLTATTAELTAQLAALKRENEELKQENAELKERERQAILHERDTLKEIITQEDAKPFGLSPTIPVFSSKSEL